MLNFTKVILHNFGSYSHAEVNLQNQGFCLVTGENHHKKDNASSNGAGKSIIWSGICFAITGETIQGIKSNLKNIYNDEDEAYVILDFLVDSSHYILTRYIAPKSDLKIIKDSIDVSGKGIRESEEKLAELLPDLTQDLIASSVIIGQGMPNKFSSFKPSGRKELLEKLTKSDFMLEDIKNRLNARNTELNTTLRDIEDRLLINKTNLATYEASLNVNMAKVKTTVKPDFDAEIKSLTVQLGSIEKDITTTKEAIKSQEATIETASTNLLNKTNEKASLTRQLYENYTAATTGLKTTKVELETKKRVAESKVKQFKDNPDKCPTCGQTLPNAEHIKAEKAKADKELATLTEQLTTILNSLAEAERKNLNYEAGIKAKFEAGLTKLTAEVNTAKIELAKLRDNLNDFSHAYELTKEQLTKINTKKETWDRDQAELTNTIKTLQKVINNLTNEIAEIEKSKTNITEHLSRVKWLITLTTRDFRGFLLADIVKYIDTKAKIYAETVFGHKDLNIYLNGNNLDISYNGKMFDSLSGGEKQRIDIIIQFAIRDLLTTYMNAGSNIIVLDEVYDNLDARATENINNLITSLNTIESIFVISHHADSLNLSYDTELHVYKNEDGISTVIQK